MAKRTKKRRAEPKFVPPAHNFLRDWFEAADKETAARESVFFDAPCELLGIRIRLMRLSDFLTLVTLKSPFVCGGPILPAAIAQFLWLLAEANDGQTALDEFMASIAHLECDALLSEINEYIQLVFLDAPTGGGAASQSCFIASVVDLIASEYHWSAAEIKALPLPQIFQYQREIAKRRGWKTAQRTSISRNAEARFMDEINKVPECHRLRWRAHQWAEMHPAEEVA